MKIKYNDKQKNNNWKKRVFVSYLSLQAESIEKLRLKRVIAVRGKVFYIWFGILFFSLTGRRSYSECG